MNNITMFDPDLESKAKASVVDAQLAEAVDSCLKAWKRRLTWQGSPRGSS